VGEVLLVLEGVGLGEDAAIAVAEERDFAQVESLTDGFDVLDHGFDGVEASVLEALRAAGTALVNEDEAVGARQWEQVGQKVSVVGAGAAVDDDKRGSATEGHVIDENAVGVNETFLLGIDGGDGLGGGERCRERTRNRNG